MVCLHRRCRHCPVSQIPPDLLGVCLKRVEQLAGRTVIVVANLKPAVLCGVESNGMILAADRATMLKSGNTPILARTGTLEATVRRTGNWKLYALAPDGSRSEELPAAHSAEGLEIHLDTAALRYGPTPFFELEENL